MIVSSSLGRVFFVMVGSCYGWFTLFGWGDIEAVISLLTIDN